MAASVKLTDSLRNRVQHLAEAGHRSAHWILCEEIRDYVERGEKREALKQDALSAWESYQQNGLHLTLEDADDWLTKLESGEDSELPQCHE